MPTPFNALHERLLRAGVAPRHVRRYLRELNDHLADLRGEEERAGRNPAEAESAAITRLGAIDDLCNAMVEQRQLKSWSFRAPWAMFGVVPILILAGAYLVACLILWSGWKIFLPGSSTPFVPIEGPAIFYFGIGRLLYFSAPILVGWGIGLVAARQRLRMIWPAAGWILLAFIGSSAHVHAGRPSVAGAVGRITMDLTVGTSVPNIYSGLFHALVILSFAVLPFAVWQFWRLQRDRFASA